VGDVTGVSECNAMSVYRGDHTEAIEVDYDPNEVSYSELLDLFWKNHDPTARTSKQVCAPTQKGPPATPVL
jgi:peptide methionine sulfoxide reductase MsrA